MRIAIIGTRGIPNYHGGFEQFAEFFSLYLVNEGHNVYVYNSHDHPYKERLYNGVNVIHCYDPENLIGTAGQFIYDFNCIIDSRKRNFDVILQLGYTSSSVWHRLLPKKSIIITNMDGLEWKRSKYSKPVQRFLKYAEKIAVRNSDYLVSDSLGIKNYLKETYAVDSEYIAYGAEVFDSPDVSILPQYKLEANKYNMLIARLEPENNIEIILDGVVSSKNKLPFLVVGKHDVNSFGAYLKQKYNKVDNIRFVGGIYDLESLNNLRFFSNLYFHGHSVGGTNPSLLEAMASQALVIAHENQFNKSILESDAFYFKNKKDIKDLITNISKENYEAKVENCLMKIKTKYNWNIINKAYLDYIHSCIKST